MTRLLALASPRMHGPDVKAAQKLLHDNRWKTNFHPGMADGVYGVKTAHATRRAKFELGYSRRKWHGRNGTTYGHELESYLVPHTHPKHKKLPVPNRLRRRIRKAPPVGWRKGSVIEAKKHIGYKENPPGSNETMFNKWYYGANVSAPWCCIFVSYCRNKAGDHNWHYSFVPTVLELARANMGRMTIVTEPENGDLPCYDWDKDGTPDHIEFFDAWIVKGQTFYAVGGNTGPTDKSNGGEVLREERAVSDVEAFVRVNRT